MPARTPITDPWLDKTALVNADLTHQMQVTGGLISKHRVRSLDATPYESELRILRAAKAIVELARYEPLTAVEAERIRSFVDLMTEK